MSEYQDSVLMDNDNPDNLTGAEWDEIRDSLAFLGSSELIKDGGKIIQRAWSPPPTDPENVTLGVNPSPEEALAAVKTALKRNGTRSVEVLKKANGQVLIRRWTSSHYVLGEHDNVTSPPAG